MGACAMKDQQIKFWIVSKKIESYFVGIMSLMLIVSGIYMRSIMVEFLSFQDTEINFLQKMFLMDGSIIGGVIGFLMSIWAYRTALKISTSTSK